MKNIASLKHLHLLTLACITIPTGVLADAPKFADQETPSPIKTYQDNVDRSFAEMLADQRTELRRQPGGNPDGTHPAELLLSAPNTDSALTKE